MCQIKNYDTFKTMWKLKGAATKTVQKTTCDFGQIALRPFSLTADCKVADSGMGYRDVKSSNTTS